MNQFLEFAKGPLFKFSFLMMLLGLARTILIVGFGAVKAVRNASDRNIPVKSLSKETLGWLIPLRHIFSSRAFFSTVSLVFHLGLVIVPVFLLDHILLWRSGIGIAWPGISKTTADVLTLMSICTGLILLLNRIFDRNTRFLSTMLDYVLLGLILGVFSSGFVASRPYNPVAYETTMLIHVLCGNAIMLLVPFSKLAHCLLYPFLRIASNIAWRFPPRAGEAVNRTLYGEEIRKI